MKRYLILTLLLLALCILPANAQYTGWQYIDATTGGPVIIMSNDTFRVYSSNANTTTTNEQWCVANTGRHAATYPLRAGQSGFFATKNTTQELMYPFGNTPYTYNDFYHTYKNYDSGYSQAQEYFICGDTYNDLDDPWDIYISQHYYRWWILETPGIHSVGYTCNINPLDPRENAPFDLVCSDSSMSSPAISARNWTLSQPDGSIYSSTNTSLVKSLTAYGWYGLEYEACNAYGCGYSNTSTLVNITSGFIPETGISFWVHTYDAMSGAKVGPSDIGIGNVTSGGWRNSSTNLGTAKFDSTDYARLEKLTVGQNVNLCGEAPGYKETCTNVSIAYNGWEYILNLVPTSLVPTGGRSTMIVNVINSNTAATISGATITISNSSVPYSSSKLSDANGIATFANITAAGSYQISASKTGYVSATKYWPVYPDTVSNAYIGMLPVGATPVPTSTGGDPIYETPVPTSTLGPGETPDTRTDAEKDEDMMGLLRDQGPMLIQFFIVCFVVYMIMGMAGKGGR